MALRTPGLALTIALLGGCTVLGPDYQEPVTDIQPQWSKIETPALASDPPVDPAWWTAAFNDPVLDKLVQTALDQSLDLQSAAMRVLQARQSLAIAVGNQYPQSQDISGSAGRQRSNDRSENIYDLGFSLAWEADIWGRFTLAVRSAEAQLDASIADYDGVMVTLLADISANYLSIRTLQERIAVARANVTLQEKSLAIATTKYEGGEVSELDMDQATTLLYNTRALVYSFSQALQQTNNALAVLLGQTPASLKEILQQPAPLPTIAPQISIGMPQELLRRRPDVRAAERRLAAQSAEIGFAITELYPHFGISGSIGSTVDTAEGLDFDDMFSNDALGWGLFGGFQWNVLNYDRLKSNIRLQDALFQQLVVDYRNTLLQAQAEVENAIIGYLNTQKQSVDYRIAAEAAERAAGVSEYQYQEGLIEFDTVINVLSSLRAQQDQLATTRGLVAANLVDTYRALGGGWQVRGNAAPDELLPKNLKDQMLQRTKYWDDKLP